MKDNEKNVTQNEIEQKPVEPAMELADAELEKISGGMLACIKLAPCI